MEQEQSKPSRLWQIVRWIPLMLMILSVAILLGMFAASGMARIAAWYLLELIPPVLGLISLLTVIIYALVRHRKNKLLLATGLVALLSLSPLIALFVPMAYPASLSTSMPTATVRLPANVPLQVVWGGDSLEKNQHAIVPDQRWAYDFLVEPYFSGSNNLDDYGCYSVPVVAPISGYVVSAHDGEPDMTPGVLSNNMEAPTGNHVVIRMETGTYLEIAHLKQGSVTVRMGDTVTEGQVIGQCGNSGNTSEPHIHIHHQRQDPTAYPINFAEGLPLYFRDHDGPPMPQGGVRIEGGKAFATGDLVQHIGK
jgi:hypothetical protein